MKVSAEPIIHKDEYSALVETEVMAYFIEVIFEPLRDLVADAGLRANERRSDDHSALWDALLLGTVWYAAGVFTGKFNAAISRELRAIGARKTALGFYLAAMNLPMGLRGVISLSTARSVGVHKAVLSFLDQAAENQIRTEPGVVFPKTVDIIVKDLQKQLTGTMSGVKGLPAPSPAPSDLTESLREGLTQGTNRAIKNFSFEATQQLRAKVLQNLRDGGRVDRLAQVIETEFGVSQRKARIIAETETAQLVSGFRRSRYESLGSTEYRWSTSHDEKVRPTHGESNDHRILDNRVFTWASPPVVDSATGRRCHPGDDYGPCRCVARPIFNLLAA